MHNNHILQFYNLFNPPIIIVQLGCFQFFVCVFFYYNVALTFL